MFKRVSLKAAIIPAALFVLIFCKTASSQTYSNENNGGSFTLTAVIGSLFGSDGYDRYGFDCDGYNRDGYNRDGYDRSGYDRSRHERSYYDNQKRDNDRNRYKNGIYPGDDSHMYYKSDNDRRDNDKYNNDRDNNKRENNNRGKQKRDKR